MTTDIWAQIEADAKAIVAIYRFEREMEALGRVPGNAGNHPRDGFSDFRDKLETLSWSQAMTSARDEGVDDDALNAKADMWINAAIPAIDPEDVNAFTAHERPLLLAMAVGIEVLKETADRVSSLARAGSEHFTLEDRKELMRRTATDVLETTIDSTSDSELWHNEAVRRNVLSAIGDEFQKASGHRLSTLHAQDNGITRLY